VNSLKDVNPLERVLEVGVGGDGRNLGIFQRAGVRQVMAVDSRSPGSDEWIAAHKAAHDSGLQLVIWKGTMQALPFADASVDLIVATQALSQAQDLETAVAEAYRVLRPGGLYAFVENQGAPHGTCLRVQQCLADTKSAVRLCDPKRGGRVWLTRDPFSVIERIFGEANVVPKRCNLQQSEFHKEGSEAARAHVVGGFARKKPALPFPDPPKSFPRSAPEVVRAFVHEQEKFCGHVQKFLAAYPRGCTPAVHIGMAPARWSDVVMQAGTQEVLAIDLLDPTQARQKGNPAAPRDADLHRVLWHGSMEALPLKDDSVDLLITVGALSCVCNLERAIAEARRVVKKGGLYAFMEYASYVSKNTLASRWQRLYDRFACRTVERTLDPQPNFQRTFGGAPKVHVQAVQETGVVHGFVYL
jgi:ubiquinone/menaquinone biosynthesis C-methylase UbiE